MKRILIVLILIVSVLEEVISEEGIEFTFFPGEKFIITEKQDLRKRVNGRYEGFIYRETRGSLSRDNWDVNGMDYSGNIYIFQEMKRDARLIARRLEESSECEIHFLYSGEYQIDEEQTQPLLRSVPSFPDEEIFPGDRWRAYGQRIVRVDDESPYTRVNIYCEYEYSGIMIRNGGDYHSINAQYAMRYRGDDDDGDFNLSSVDGSHRLEIRIPVENPENIFMRDIVEEQYRLKNGDFITYSGIILTWFQAPLEFDRQNVEEKVNEIVHQLNSGEKSLIEITDSEEGLMLTLPNIHFIPDSDQILPDEKSRLDGIAAVLQDVPDLLFLVRGHTADVGTSESQYLLSRERALSIIKEMTIRGIPENRFLYEGKGGDFPVAPNSTEEGRRENRRVEIILME